jgi:hypothetical protein
MFKAKSLFLILVVVLGFALACAVDEEFVAVESTPAPSVVEPLVPPGSVDHLVHRFVVKPEVGQKPVVATLNDIVLLEILEAGFDNTSLNFNVRKTKRLSEDVEVREIGSAGIGYGPRAFPDEQEFQEKITIRGKDVLFNVAFWKVTEARGHFASYHMQKLPELQKGDQLVLVPPVRKDPSQGDSWIVPDFPGTIWIQVVEANRFTGVGDPTDPNMVVEVTVLGKTEYPQRIALWDYRLIPQEHRQVYSDIGVPSPGRFLEELLFGQLEGDIVQGDAFYVFPVQFFPRKSIY